MRNERIDDALMGESAGEFEEFLVAGDGVNVGHDFVHAARVRCRACVASARQKGWR